MRITSISGFRKNIKRFIDEINRDHEPLIITRPDDVSVVILPLDTFNAYSETAYLKRMPANKRHLDKSIAQLRAGKTVTRTLDDLATHE